VIGKTTMRLGSLAAIALVGAMAVASPERLNFGKLSPTSEGPKFGFVENKGQWGSDARFYLALRGLDVWVTNKSIKYSYYHQAAKPVWNTNGKGIKVPGKISGHTVEMQFLGSSNQAFPQGVGPGEGILNFILGRNSFRDINHFSEAKINSIYPGVDLRVYTDSGSPRFDLIVQPGVDPNVIRFKYAGTQAASIVDGDTMSFTTRYGQVSVNNLVAFQEIDGKRVIVPVSFAQKSGGFGFTLGEYDKSKPLIIDPVVYSTLFGGFANFSPGDDISFGVTADRFGNAYTTGLSNAPNYPITNGAFDNRLAGVDAFVTKFRTDASGLVYSTFIGGAGTEQAFGIAVDSQGRASIAGITTSPSDPVGNPLPTTPGAPQEFFGGGGQDGFVARLSADGRALDFGTYMGGNGDDAINGIAVDGADNMYGAGNTDAPDFPITGGVIQPAYGGGLGDAVAFRIGANGALDYSTFLGGVSTDDAVGVAVNAVGEAHFTGNTASANFPLTAGAYDTSVQGSDAWIAKVNPSGSAFEYSTALGGSSGDGVSAITIDASGSAYVVGSTSSVDFPRTAGAFDEVYNPPSENYVTKLAIDGTTLVYSTFLSSGFTPRGIGVDDLGAAYVVGHDAFVATGQVSDDPTYNGPPLFVLGDAILAALDDSGSNLLYGGFFGGAADDGAFGIFVDRSRNAFIAGTTASFRAPNAVEFPTTTGVFKESMFPDASPTSAFWDGFLMKVKIRLTPILQTFSIAPDTVAGTETAVATIGLTSPASPGGAVIRLSSSNEAVARPVNGAGTQIDEIVIPEGSATGNFNVATSDVVNAVAVTITAELEGDTKTARIIVGPWLTNMTLSPNTIVGGNRVTGRVQLLRPATAGLTVSISSNNSALAFAVDSAGNRINSFVVPTGNTTSTFDILTRGVDAEQQVTLLAKITTPNLQVSRSQVLRIRPASLRSIAFDPNRVNGGERVQGTVFMDGEVGPSPVSIDLSLGTTGNPPVGVTLPNPPVVVVRRDPTNVEIGKSANFFVTAGIASANSFRNVVATRPNVTPAQVRTAALFIDANDMAGITLSSNSVVGGAIVTGSVGLNSPAAASGFALAVRTSDLAFAPLNGNSTQINLTVPAGAIRTADFTVNTKLTTTTKNVTISAIKAGYVTRTAPLVVRALSFTFTVTPTSVVGGATNPTGTLTLSDAQGAPANVVRITLSNSNPTACSIPSFVLFPTGSQSQAFTVTTRSVTTPQVATITATLFTLPTTTVRTQSITVNPLNITLTVNPGTVVGGTPSTGRATISNPAGPQGVNIALSSNNANAIVPGSVNIAQAQTSNTFNITTREVAADQTATITARTPAGVTATADLRITAIGVTLRINPDTVTGGLQTSSAQVSITNAAPRLLTATISSNNTAAARPAVGSVTIPQGQTQSGSVTINTSPVGVDTTVTFTATLTATGRTGTANLRVLSPRLIDFTLTSFSVVGGASTTGRVEINIASQSGPVPVSLSSANPGVAQVPVSVNIPTSQRVATFTVTTSVVPVDTDVVLTARVVDSTRTVTISVLAPTLVSLTLNPSTVIGGNSTSATVTIDRPAPAGGLTITIAKSATSTGSPYVNIPTTVTIPAGSRTRTFTITTLAVSRSASSLLSARFSQRSQEVNAILTLLPR
jgi:hypothetical protein